mgnify:CR=1 FL=1
MPGLGTFANVCGIVIGGLLGLGCGRLLTKRLQDTLMMATAVASSSSASAAPCARCSTSHQKDSR